jgi:site-specific recombinase XerD
MIAKGIPRQFLSKMLGHSKESTTQHYYDVNFVMINKGLEKFI